MGHAVSMTERADHIANNTWLVLVGRVTMAVTGALFVPAIIGAWTWASSTGEDIELLRNRVTILETNDSLGRQDRRRFQDETTAGLRELLRLVSLGNERQARLEAQIEALQKQIDR